VNPRGAALYAASARRVLVAHGLHGFGERLRPHDDRLVLVLGSPRSGTTFLAGAIGAMPGFVDLTEVTPHKAAIPRLSTMPEQQAAAEIRRVLERVRRLALVPGWRGVEQTPETAFVLPAALLAYPRARAVHALRDGRDVVCSLLERGWLSSGRAGGDDAKAAYGKAARFWVEPDRLAEFESASDATRAAWAWRRYVSAGLGGGGQRALVVRYESLAESPEAIAKHLDTDPAPLEAALGSFHDRSIGRYQRDLSAEQLADVEREAGTLLAELGYA
jgi:hypothetical protein